MISKVNEGDKLFFNSIEQVFLIDTRNIFRPFYRFYSSQSRETTIKHILIIYDVIFDKIESLIKMRYNFNFTNQNSLLDENYNKYTYCIDQIKTMVEELEKSIEGLKNLRKTYESDASIIIQLTLLIDNIKKFISFTNESLKELYKYFGYTDLQSINTQPQNLTTPIPINTQQTNSQSQLQFVV